MNSRYKVALAAAHLAIEVAIEQCFDERDVAEPEYIHTRLTDSTARSPSARGLWE